MIMEIKLEKEVKFTKLQLLVTQLEILLKILLDHLLTFLLSLWPLFLLFLDPNLLKFIPFHHCDLMQTFIYFYTFFILF